MSKESNKSKKSNRAAVSITAKCHTYSPEEECIYFEPLTDKTPVKECKFVRAEGCLVCTCKEAIDDALRKRINGY